MSDNPTPTNTPISPMDELENILERLHDYWVKDDSKNGIQASTAVALLKAREQSIREEVRKTAKQESAHDFDNIVKAYNLAIESKFDRLSVTRLYFAINGADSRAKFINLPEQTALHSPTQLKGDNNE